MNILKIFKLSFLILLVCYKSISAQTQHIDSLILASKYANSYNDKIVILLDIANEYKKNESNKALLFADQAYKLAVENNNKEDELSSLILKSEISWSQTDFKSAINNTNQSISLAHDLANNNKLALAFLVKGLVFIDLGEYDKSAELYFNALKLYEGLEDKKGMANSLRRIASVYYDQKNYDKALKYYFQSLNIFKEIDDKEGIASGYNDIAAVYGNIHQYEMVEKYLNEAIIINKKLDDKRAYAINNINLGVINQRLEKYEEAKDYYYVALGYFKQLNHPVLLTKGQIILAGYYFEIHQTDSCIDYANKAYTLGLEYNLKKSIYDATDILYKCYLQQNDSSLSDKFLIINYQIKDSLDIEASVVELSKREFKYQMEKEKQVSEMKQQRQDFVVLIIIIILILGLGIILLILTRQKIKAKNTALEKENLEIELAFKNKELALKVMSLLKKNEILSDISKKLVDVKNDAVKQETKIAINKIYKELQKTTDIEIWEEFELRFKQVHSDFYDQLMKRFPDLTPSEQRLCAFLRLNMSSKEISSLTGQSLNALETARYRLRKKLGISNSQINMISFLSQL